MTILLGMVSLVVRACGRASWADPITIWYAMSVAWLALLVAALQSAPCQRSVIMKRAFVAMLVCLLCSALPYGLFTDDILRYQWDGWLTAHQVSPFSLPPNAPALRHLRFDTGVQFLPDVLPYSSMLTIYPPGAQLIFAAASLVSGGDASVWKLALWAIYGALGVATWRMTAKQQRGWVLLCALSPVVLLHGFIDGHIDMAMALVMMMSISARRAHQIVLSGVLLGAAISIKYLPIVAITVLLIGLERRDQCRLIVATISTLAIIYLPFTGPNVLGSLGTFTASWQTNSASYSILAFLVGDALTRPILGFLALVFSSIIVMRWRRQPGVALTMALTLLAILSPVVHPWYLIAPLSLAPLAPLRSVFIWTFTIALYAVGYSTYKGSGVWFEHPAALAFEFIPVVVALIVDYQRGPLALLNDDRS